MYIKSVTLAAIMATSLSTLAFAGETTVQKVGLIEDVGGQERIDMSGKLRMLSQRIAASACHLSEGVDKDATAAMLQSSAQEFDKILNALEHGDDSLNIKGAETKRKTLAKIEAVKERWAPLKEAALAMASGDLSEGNVNTVLDGNLALLGAAVELVPAIVGEYSNPAEIIQADAILIDIAGRQRMLTQRISKQACLLASHHANDGTAEKLQKDISIFEASLNALRKGMPQSGIKAPPTIEIKDELEVVYKTWLGLKPELDKVLSGQEVSQEEETKKFHDLNKTMAEMNKVVGMYAQFAKQGL